MKTVLASILALSLTTPAWSLCFERDAFIKAAKERYGEIPVWTGKGDNGLTVTMVINPETQTWGIVHGDEKNVCLVITGKGLAPVAVGDPV